MIKVAGTKPQNDYSNAGIIAVGKIPSHADRRTKFKKAETFEQKVIAFIGERVEGDDMCGYIWGIDGNSGMQMVAEVRGWGAIQHLYRDEKGNYDLDAAAEFQDGLRNWIADAINQKLQRLIEAEAQ